jgi:very-short-patch-repair endonuclease
LKPSKRPGNLAKNASKLHKHVGELLTSSSLFNGFEIRQEYNVCKINPSYESGREKIDWVILALNVCIEVHGQQHERPVCFGGIDMSEAEDNFRRQQERDAAKKKAVEDVGWAYVVVWYNEKDITLEALQARINQAIKDIKVEESKEKLNGIKRKMECDDRQKNRPRSKSKIPQRKEHKWPKQKIPSRKFGK